MEATTIVVRYLFEVGLLHGSGATAEPEGVQESARTNALLCCDLPGRAIDLVDRDRGLLADRIEILGGTRGDGQVAGDAEGSTAEGDLGDQAVDLVSTEADYHHVRRARPLPGIAGGGASMQGELRRRRDLDIEARAA